MFLFCGVGSNPLSQVVWSSVSKSLTSLLKNLGRRKSGERERPRGLNCPNISWKLQNLIKISPVQSFACRMLPKEKHQSELNRPSFLGPFPKLAFLPTGGLSKWPSLSLSCVCVSAPAASKDEKQISEGQRGCYIVPVFTTNTGRFLLGGTREIISSDDKYRFLQNYPLVPLFIQQIYANTARFSWGSNFTVLTKYSQPFLAQKEWMWWWWYWQVSLRWW